MKIIFEKKKRGLWANIHAKRKRGEKPAKPGDKDYPDKEQWDKLTKEELEQIVNEELQQVLEQDEKKQIADTNKDNVKLAITNTRIARARSEAARVAGSSKERSYRQEEEQKARNLEREIRKAATSGEMTTKPPTGQLNEMEPYQREMHKQHPKWKVRLIGKGGQKNTAPYTDKPSMKRAKSAPPMQEVKYKTSSVIDPNVFKFCSTLIKYENELEQANKEQRKIDGGVQNIRSPIDFIKTIKYTADKIRKQQPWNIYDPQQFKQFSDYARNNQQDIMILFGTWLGLGGHQDINLEIKQLIDVIGNTRNTATPEDSMLAKYK